MSDLTRTLTVQFRYDLDQTRRWLRVYLGTLLPPTLVLLLAFCAVSAFVLTLGRFRAVTIPANAAAALVFSFCNAVVAFVGGQLLSGLVVIVIMLFIFVPLAITTWFAVRTVLNIAYPLFFSVAHAATRREKRFNSFFSRKLRRKTLLVHSAFLVAFTMAFLFAIGEYGMSGELVARSAGIAFCLAVPYVFAFHWTFFLRVLRSKDRAGRKAALFKDYLFSDGSIRSAFLTSVKFMVFIAILPWVLLPIPMRASARVALNAEAYFALLVPGYDAMRGEAERQLILHPGYEWVKMLPSPGHVRSGFDVFGGLRDALCPDRGSPLFLGYLFLLVALVSLMQVALPVCVRAVRERGYGGAIRKLLLASVKTTTVVILLNLFVAKAFLIDFGSVLGVGTAFTYGLAAFLAFQNREKEKTERTTSPTVQ